MRPDKPATQTRVGPVALKRGDSVPKQECRQLLETSLAVIAGWELLLTPDGLRAGIAAK